MTLAEDPCLEMWPNLRRILWEGWERVELEGDCQERIQEVSSSAEGVVEIEEESSSSPKSRRRSLVVARPPAGVCFSAGIGGLFGSGRSLFGRGCSCGSGPLFCGICRRCSFWLYMCSTFSMMGGGERFRLIAPPCEMGSLRASEGKEGAKSERKSDERPLLVE